MKTLITLTIAIFLFSCGGNANKEEATNNETPNQTTQIETEEPAATSEPEETVNHLIGTWTFTDPKINVTQIITYKEDNTYTMKMGPVDIEGTWELNDSILITKSRPDAPGQKKTITKLDESDLWTIWEPKGGKARELRYSRN